MKEIEGNIYEPNLVIFGKTLPRRSKAQHPGKGNALSRDKKMRELGNSVRQILIGVWRSQ